MTEATMSQQQREETFQENNVGHRMNGEKRPVTESTVDVGSHDNKAASPTDALLGNGVPDTSVSETQNQKDERSQKAHGEQCCSRTQRWLKKNEYFVLTLGLLTFLVGCLLLTVSVYMMHTRPRCQTESSVSLSPLRQAAESANTTTPLNTTPLHGMPPDITAPDNTSDNTTHSTTTPLISTTEADLLLTNMALSRVAYQSSTMIDDNLMYHASLATDGATDYVFTKGSCSRTNMERRPFWYVDLGRLELVKVVRIFIPRDEPAGELHNFEVRIGQGKEIDLNPLCRHYMGTALLFTLTIKCHRPMYGRYVSIALLGDATRPVNRLTLCEVQVYNT